MQFSFFQKDNKSTFPANKDKQDTLAIRKDGNNEKNSILFTMLFTKRNGRQQLLCRYPS